MSGLKQNRSIVVWKNLLTIESGHLVEVYQYTNEDSCPEERKRKCSINTKPVYW